MKNIATLILRKITTNIFKVLQVFPMPFRLFRTHRFPAVCEDEIQREYPEHKNNFRQSKGTLCILKIRQYM